MCEVYLFKGCGNRKRELVRVDSHELFRLHNERIKEKKNACFDYVFTAIKYKSTKHSGAKHDRGLPTLINSHPRLTHS